MAPKCATNVHPVAKVAVSVANAVVKAAVNVVANAARAMQPSAKTTPLKQR